MEPVLLMDIGSTFTKVCSLDMDSGTVLGTAQSGTTIDDDVCIGIDKASALLEEKTGIREYSKKLACSSAAGGLAVMVSGLVESLTLKAAKLAAMGAGAKIIRGFHHKLTGEDLDFISMSDFDIFLLAGGTDGGNTDIIIHNAHGIASINKDFPIVLAGNRVAADECRRILESSGKEVHLCPNILPKVDLLDTQTVNEVIRKIFTGRITKAKGISKAEELVEGVMMPTPYAVLSAVRLLSEGAGDEPGIGELMAVDVGGATTDVHSFCDGYQSPDNTVFEGFAEPKLKRTVEGDLGVRHNAAAIVEAVAGKPSNPFKNRSTLLQELEAISTDPWLLTLDAFPGFDDELCKTAISIATERHCGTSEQRYTANGIRYIQRGKNLSDVRTVIGTGGVLANSPNALEIMKSAIYTDREPDSLRPRNPEIYIDRKYILPAMGLLGTVNPELALRIMKKEIIGKHRG
ncbi:MAG: methylaspartate mutase accessory protein GlmL [Clostridia bacterium]|nr:methylaspartate mutase accessory protein GlmL [Clostridia bacterium]